jgi:hypothetical protein
MKTDSEIKLLGLEVLNNYLGMVEAERFIVLIQRDKFDYTKWRETLFEGLTGEEISIKAMAFQKKIV